MKKLLTMVLVLALLLTGCRPPVYWRFYPLYPGRWKRKAAERAPTCTNRVKLCRTRPMRVLLRDEFSTRLFFIYIFNLHFILFVCI